jgi:hypothetical protein
MFSRRRHGRCFGLGMPPNGSWVLAFALGTVACGLTVVGEPASEREEASTPAEAPLESQLETRGPNGGASGSATSSPCVGCDAGRTDAVPILACDTYRACAPGESCCYDPQSGSRCARSCAAGAIKLCRLGVDGCGQEEECDDLSTPPASGVGACVPD